jgi:gliding motility-associated lipoprotein GldD
MSLKGKYFYMIIMGVFICACNSTYTSKKEGFFKIELPEKKYRLFEEPGFPYSFEYPVYANIVRDSTYFDASPENNYWRNIDFPAFDAKIFLSYKEIGGKALYKVKGPDGKYRDSFGINSFDKMVSDAFKLTNKNDDAATSKKILPFTGPDHVSGILFQLGGNAATQRQFFMTDSSKNFLRGALYFYASPNADSVKPVVDFLQKDIDHLISTFHWKSSGK